MKRLLGILIVFMTSFGIGTNVVAQEVAQQPESAGPGILLEYKFKEGELLRYKLEMSFDMVMQADIPEASAIPPISGFMTGTIRQRTKRVLENGDAEIVAAVESMKLDMMGQSNELPVDKMPTCTFIKSKSGAIKAVEGKKFESPFSEIPFGDLANFSQHSVLPTSRLKVGETWKQDIPSPFPGAGTFHVEMKLQRLDAEVEKIRAAVIQQSATGDMDIAQAMAALQKGNDEVSGKASISANSIIYFSPEQGRLLKVEGTGSMQMNMSFNGQNTSPGQMKMNAQLKFNISLLPDKEK